MKHNFLTAHGSRLTAHGSRLTAHGSRLIIFICLSMFAQSKVSSQTCCDLVCYNSLNHILYCGDYDKSAGPYYVKLYLRFVDPDEQGAFEDSFDDRADLIFENLNRAFSPHNIFFIPGFGGCAGAGSYQVIESDILPDPDEDLGPFNTLMAGSTNGVSHYISGGINLYIFRDDVYAPIPGHSFCTPNDYCYIAGLNPWTLDTPLSKTKESVAHEVAHCLGLLHTHHNDGVGPGNGCVDDGSNCVELGDLVCDTPPDNGSFGTPTDCDENNPLAMNIMSYFPIRTCPDRFTPGQGERMRHYLKNGLGVLSQVVMSDIIITGATTWNSPTDVPANIIIKPGGSLTLNATVNMQENAFIFIEANDDSGSSASGGRLQVHSLVTAACPDKLWQGVIVDGLVDQEQSTQKQGRLYIGNGGIIEHAQIGARVIGHSFISGNLLQYRTGGVVVSTLGEFRDNVVGVSFAPYVKRNSSQFFRTVFSTTDDYRAADIAPTHAIFDGVRDLKLFSCRFEDLREAPYTNPTTRGTGIKAQDANFSVSLSSKFSYLFEGINVREVSGLVGNRVVASTFDRCFTGIFSQENNNFVFNNDTFNLERPPYYVGPSNTVFKGIEMEGKTKSFMVSGNEFISTDFNETDRHIGTDALAITTDNNGISKNYYENLHISNRARGQNAISGEMLFSGLVYECNTYEGNLEHDHLVANGAIRREQGPRDGQDARIASGNRYFGIQGPPLIAQQFTNFGQEIDYHHRDINGSPEQLLEDYYTDMTVTPVDSDENPNCGGGGETGCPNPPCPEPFISTVKTQFFQEKQVWQAKMAAFPNITHTDTLQSEANAINRLRFSLDRLGNTVLLHHALDTNGIELDSVLVWLDNMDSYDADVQLARHHFFAGNYALADSLLADIPARYDISGDLLAEFEDIVAILAVIRPALEDTIGLNQLPEGLIDTLANTWGTYCTAAGALARDLLYRNGHRYYPECDTILGRPSSASVSLVEHPLTSGIRVYPNPANKFVTLERNGSVSEINVRFVQLGTGRVCLERTLLVTEPSITVDLTFLAAGIYAIIFQGARESGQVKLVVSH